VSDDVDKRAVGGFLAVLASAILLFLADPVVFKLHRSPAQEFGSSLAFWFSLLAVGRAVVAGFRGERRAWWWAPWVALVLTSPWWATWIGVFLYGMIKIPRGS
jgi:hypothetical protein